MELRTVCVFAGSSPGVRSDYSHAARMLGEEIARQELGLVYGGASVGLMGVLADAALAGGADVAGVITEALVDLEVAHPGLTRLEVVETMHQRKALMADRADAFIMLPGGFGTYEEFFEAVTWTQLGIHAKPCGILNVDGFFDPLLALIARAVEDRFVRAENAEIVRVADEPAALLDRLRSFVPVAVDKWLDRRQR